MIGKDNEDEKCYKKNTKIKEGSKGMWEGEGQRRYTEKEKGMWEGKRQRRQRKKVRCEREGQRR